MKNTKSVLLLALALLTAVMSAFLASASVHAYCENRAGAGVLLATAIAISYVRVRGSVKGPIPHVLAIVTYLACTLAVTANVLFIVHASKLCRDYFTWLWTPVILVSYGLLLLWAWLKWRGQSPRFPAPLLRSRAVFLGLLFGTISASFFAGFWVHIYLVGYLVELTLPLAVFFYFSLGLSILGFMLGFLGKGVLRVAVIIVSAVMVFVWWMELSVGSMY
jgi:hypothetical protein